MSNRVKLGPNRTGEGEILRGNEGIGRRFEEESWNSSLHSCWESGLNKELEKDNLVVLLEISDSSGLESLLDGASCWRHCYWHQRAHAAEGCS